MLTGSDMRAAGRWTLDRDPYLLETSVPGILACGDVRFGPVKRVAAAVGEGSMAIAFVHQFLKDAGAEPDGSPLVNTPGSNALTCVTRRGPRPPGYRRWPLRGHPRA